MIAINPIQLNGPWQMGIALDRHTISSTYLGIDEFGHDRFETKRSEIGELLYRLKYQNDVTALGEIADTVTHYIRDSWKIAKVLDGIVPVPPSNTSRRMQPVIELAKAVGNQLQIPVLENLVKKTKTTSQLKNISDYDQRTKELGAAFTVDRMQAKGKTIVLLDDLYQSGATLEAVARALRKEGNVKAVFALTVTKTRG